MDVAVIPIWNSKGIQLPKVLIDKYKITDIVELILEKEYIIIRPKAMPRQGWDKAFNAMHANKDDKPLLPFLLNGKFLRR